MLKTKRRIKPLLTAERLLYRYLNTERRVEYGLNSDNRRIKRELKKRGAQDAKLYTRILGRNRRGNVFN
jgi:hypothetical protein